MYSVEVKNNKEIYEFCMLNGITDINKFIQDCFKQGFDIRKYGLLGETLNEGEKDLITGGIGEKQVEIEVIKEIRVEVPVEVIKEIEVIKEVTVEVPVEVTVEVPVEVTVEVIKEVPIEKVVTKIEYISDDTQVNELLLKTQQLEQELSTKTTEIDTINREFSTKTTEMENIFQNKMSKKDEELDELRRNLDIKDDNKTKMLETTLQNLRKELSLKNNKITELEGKIKQLEVVNQNVGAIYMKGSNLKQNL